MRHYSYHIRHVTLKFLGHFRLSDNFSCINNNNDESVSACKYRIFKMPEWVDMKIQCRSGLMWCEDNNCNVKYNTW